MGTTVNVQVREQLTSNYLFITLAQDMVKITTENFHIDYFALFAISVEIQ